MQSFQGKPFYLTPAQCDWVEKTFESLSVEEKIGQLFCLIAYGSDEAYLKTVFDVFKPGGVMLRPMPLDEVVGSVRYLQQTSEVPMLIAANLERGANGAILEGTNFASPMEIAATDNVEMAARLGEICGSEAAAAGVNWSFAPIIDIDYNFRSPITNTRTFGSDPQRVREMGAAYTRAVQKQDVAASIKHFPGDGRDERDQHLVTSINDCSAEEWDATYGAAYRESIDAGALTVMIGHIMQPAWQRRLEPGIADGDLLPASLSHALVTKLLKDRLGFKGLVVTDASTMAGLTTAMPRKKAVPATIATGCDMFLFCRNVEEDYGFMKAGVEDGTISPERLEAAVKNVLALKAALHLPEKKADGSLLPKLEQAQKHIGTPEHKAWAKECAQKSITLVKEESGVLPISPEKTPRVLFYSIESGPNYMDKQGAQAARQFKALLEKEGFTVTEFEPAKGQEGAMLPVGEYESKYDLIIYLADLATKSNQTVVRIEWALPFGANVPMFQHTIPTIFISVQNPYHLLDVPRVRTFINTYHGSPIVLETLMEKLRGREPFEGKSPVDPFCGRWDTKY